MNTISQKLSIAIGVAGCLLASSHAFASTLTIPPGGAQANITGCVVVNPSGVFFSGSDLCAVPNTFDPGAPNTGSYTNEAGGTIQNLLGAPVTGNLAVPIVNFAVFTVATGNVHFDLMSIDAGIGSLAGCTSNAVGSVCTPMGSPFTLTQVTSNKVSISLGLEGIAYIGTSATGANVTGALFTSQNLVPGTITGILALAASPGGFQDTYSATFSSTTVIPEPGTYVLLGLGLISMASLRRRTRKG